MDETWIRIHRIKWLLWRKYPQQANDVIHWQNSKQIHLPKICGIFYFCSSRLVGQFLKWLESKIFSYYDYVSTWWRYRVSSFSKSFDWLWDSVCLSSTSQSKIWSASNARTIRRWYEAGISVSLRWIVYEGNYWLHKRLSAKSTRTCDGLSD